MVFIDAHNYIKRVYHGGGNPYSLFYSLLLNQTEEVQLVCDTSTSRAYRRSIHPDYKKGRNAGDDPVYWEVYENIQQAALRHGVAVVQVFQGEADDYIALTAEKGDTVISNDKDLWPLILNSITVKIEGSTRVTPELVALKFAADVRHIYLYKALVGDPSDRIPGKRGFGKAAWSKLTEAERDELNYKFLNGDFEGWPESVEMSWKLARPYHHYAPQLLSRDDNPAQTVFDYFISKGVTL